MSKFLFVVPPWTGHVNPTVSVARQLVAAGHEVAWAGYPNQIGPLLPPGATLHPISGADDPWSAQELARSQTLRHLESLRFLWESMLVPLARAMREPVEAIIDRARPDVVIVDQQAIGGALAARRAGVRWASFCTTSASVTDALSGLPKVKAWVDDQLAGLERDAGLPAAAVPDLSPERVIVFSTEALVSQAGGFPDHFRFVGPAIADRPDATAFPWDDLAAPGVRRIFASLGTVSFDRATPFYDLIVEAVADQPWQLVLVAPEGRLPAPPANVIVRPRVPQLALLPHVHAVVSHAGHNTVCETLANGLPLVVTPIRDDQPVIADQVVRAGAGVRLHFGRLTARALREALSKVLDDPGYAAAARVVQQSFAAAGGAATAARLLEELIA